VFLNLLKFSVLGVIVSATQTFANSDMRVVNYDESNSVATAQIVDRQGGACTTTFYMSESIKSSSCIRLTNSKGIKILCTPKKRICKTQTEVVQFLFSNNAKPTPSNKRLNLKEGMPYSKAREIIMNAQWQGKNQKAQNISEFGEVKRIYFDNGWREIQDCAGTGTAPCRFEFSNSKNETLAVITQGECVKTKNIACEKYVASWSIE
jgi:hypothetical protein